MTQQSADSEGAPMPSPPQHQAGFQGGTGQVTLKAPPRRRRAACLPLHLAAIPHTWQGRCFISGAQFLTRSLQDLTISALLGKMAGNSWTDHSDVKIG